MVLAELESRTSQLISNGKWFPLLPTRSYRRGYASKLLEKEVKSHEIIYAEEPLQCTVLHIFHNLCLPTNTLENLPTLL